MSSGGRAAAGSELKLRGEASEGTESRRTAHGQAVVLSLDAALRDAADEVALQGEEQGHDRDRDDDGSGGEVTPLGRVVAHIVVQA